MLGRGVSTDTPLPRPKLLTRQLTTTYTQKFSGQTLLARTTPYRPCWLLDTDGYFEASSASWVSGSWNKLSSTSSCFQNRRAHTTHAPSSRGSSFPPGVRSSSSKFAARHRCMLKLGALTTNSIETNQSSQNLATNFLTNKRSQNLAM